MHVTRLAGRTGMALCLIFTATVGTATATLVFSSPASATIYNRCNVILFNDTGIAMKLKSAEKYSHDDWIVGNRPPLENMNRNTWGDGKTPMINGTGAGNFWGTESGFARGCWNKVTCSDAQGSVVVYVSDPYRGANEYSCTASGMLRCSGPKPAGWRDYRYGKDVSEGSVLSGDNLKVIYYLCSTNYRGCS